MDPEVEIEVGVAASDVAAGVAIGMGHVGRDEYGVSD